MKKVIEKLTDHLAGRPGKIFLIDSIGAIFTSLFLFLVLRNFSDAFGMPKTILACLSLIAACFCLYSVNCFLFLKGKWTLFIRIISVANLLYCALTLGLLFMHYNQLTLLGLTYFLVEILTVCGLVYIELTIANRILIIGKEQGS